MLGDATRTASVATTERRNIVSSAIDGKMRHLHGKVSFARTSTKMQRKLMALL